MMREAGCTKKVIVGGWSSAPYGTRVDTEGGIMNAHVSLVYRAITLRGAALPMTGQEDFLESSKALGCFDAITQGDGVVSGETVLDIGFSNVNPVIHVPGTLLGVSTMENFNTVLRSEQARLQHLQPTASVLRLSEVQYQFYDEEIGAR